MAKITAIHGGGDWADASAEYLVLPDGMDIETEHAAYRVWYRTEYFPAVDAGKNPKFVTLYEWLKQKGARDPDDDEFQVFFDA